MLLSQTIKEPLSLVTARQYAKDLERFARIEDSISASRDTSKLLRLVKGFNRHIQRYTQEKQK